MRAVLLALLATAPLAGCLDPPPVLLEYATYERSGDRISLVATLRSGTQPPFEAGAADFSLANAAGTLFAANATATASAQDAFPTRVHVPTNGSASGRLVFDDFYGEPVLLAFDANGVTARVPLREADRLRGLYDQESVYIHPAR